MLGKGDPVLPGDPQAGSKEHIESFLDLFEVLIPHFELPHDRVGSLYPRPDLLDAVGKAAGINKYPAEGHEIPIGFLGPHEVF